MRAPRGAPAAAGPLQSWIGTRLRVEHLAAVQPPELDWSCQEVPERPPPPLPPVTAGEHLDNGPRRLSLSTGLLSPVEAGLLLDGIDPQARSIGASARLAPLP